MIQQSIQEVMAGQNLNFDTAKAVMDEIMSGQATQAQMEMCIRDRHSTHRCINFSFP